MSTPPLSWGSIVRLGLVQTAMGAIVVLTTSTMNRVMVVELMLPAALPGALVALHYGVQMLRPRFGHGSDVGKRRSPWILGGMAVLAAGGVGAAAATAWMETNPPAGIAAAVAAFVLIGLGVGASGTSLLALLATRVAPVRRPAAAMIVWVMMIAGFAVTATIAGHYLDPFSTGRLITVTAVVGTIAMAVTALAIWGVEGRSPAPPDAVTANAKTSRTDFREALRQIWSEPATRRFTLFVFVAMLAYSAQDLILEPFAGVVFGLTPGESTQLAGLQNGGVLAGMLLVALIGGLLGKRRQGVLRACTIGGCSASAVALFGLAAAGFVGPDWPLQGSVFFLGFANGAFAVAAIASMMELAGAGRASREGIRMGLWGAAQALAFGLGGLAATGLVDLVRSLTGSPLSAYALVFTIEGFLFIAAAIIAARLGRPQDTPSRAPEPDTRILATNFSQG
ncbi:MAG: BCD family MFS transporter [Alphaproteobacteria bacterium]